VMGLTSNKNFITTNAVESILAQPRKAHEEMVYTAKPGYGEVPQYLSRNKERIVAEKEELENYIRLRSSQVNSSRVVTKWWHRLCVNVSAWQCL
jgi:hypothetical protein